MAYTAVASSPHRNAFKIIPKKQYVLFTMKSPAKQAQVSVKNSVNQQLILPKSTQYYNLFKQSTHTFIRCLYIYFLKHSQLLKKRTNCYNLTSCKHDVQFLSIREQLTTEIKCSYKVIKT